MRLMKILMLLILAGCSSVMVYGQGAISGVVVDKANGEPIIGATVLIQNSVKGAVTDAEGKYEITGLVAGKYGIEASFVSYTTIAVQDVEVSDGKTTELNVVLEPGVSLDEIVVTTVRKMNTEVAMINETRKSMMVMSAVSSQQIGRMQDRDASEVVKRIPGISIIEDKFIIARGLSQRYNNVWINNSAVPSSEADTRAFSFDIIPSGQIENIMILKSPAPEIPADFTGGFIKINTKDMPSENTNVISYGIGIDEKTQFRNFKYSKGSGTDFLGFDNGMRKFKGGMSGRIDNANASAITDITRNGFNNDWRILTKKPIPDQKFSYMFGRRYQWEHNRKFALTGAVNYSNSFKSILNMENSRYGIYNKVEDKPEYLYNYRDNQYTNSVKLGAMLNFTYLTDKGKFDFRNIFNQLGSSKLTERSGWQNISSFYIQEKTEYLYSSRTSYSGQFSGSHTLQKGKLDWNVGYSYANKNQPDRRIVNRQENTLNGDRYYGLMRFDQNDISRDFIRLDEHILSSGINYNYTFNEGGRFKPVLKTGLYGEYRTRDYKNRTFNYRYNQANLPSDFPYLPVVGGILNESNYAADKLYIYDDTDNRDSYQGDDWLVAAYAGLNIPVTNRLNVYAGVRFESNHMALTNYTRFNEYLTKKNDYDQNDLFPSVNVTYNIDSKQLLRFAYGKSINRQEFREVSSSVYYDFDLFSDVKGNHDLRPAYIHKFELWYEIYPSPAEMISVSFFYKNFRNPIEWTYLDAGGSYTYTFENAERARNFGIEVEVKKDLSFIGLDNFSVGLNASWIDSKVFFAEGSLEHDRPMQGQSPYLVNAGLYYESEKLGLTAGVLYNRIGKRIVGIGKIDTSEGGSIDNDIPDMYEMPRNSLDVVLGKKIGKIVEIKASVRDILAEPVVFSQFPKYMDSQGKMMEREQVTKKYDVGRYFTLNVNISF